MLEWGWGRKLALAGGPAVFWLSVDRKGRDALPTLPGVGSAQRPIVALCGVRKLASALQSPLYLRTSGSQACPGRVGVAVAVDVCVAVAVRVEVGVWLAVGVSVGVGVSV